MKKINSQILPKKGKIVIIRMKIFDAKLSFGRKCDLKYHDNYENFTEIKYQ